MKLFNKPGWIQTIHQAQILAVPVADEEAITTVEHLEARVEALLEELVQEAQAEGEDPVADLAGLLPEVEDRLLGLETPKEIAQAVMMTDRMATLLQTVKEQAETARLTRIRKRALTQEELTELHNERTARSFAESLSDVF